MKFIFIVIFLGICFGCSMQTPSEGVKSGYIVKLGQEGVLFKTIQGELIRGGFQDGSGAMGSIFTFTIEDLDVLRDAKDALSGNQEVIIHYRNPLFSGAWRSETTPPNFVFKIEVL